MRRSAGEKPVSIVDTGTVSVVVRVSGALDTIDDEARLIDTLEKTAAAPPREPRRVRRDGGTVSLA